MKAAVHRPFQETVTVEAVRDRVPTPEGVVLSAAEWLHDPDAYRSGSITVIDRFGA